MAYYRRPRSPSRRSRYSRPKRQNVWVRQQQREAVPNTDAMADFDCLPDAFIDTGAVVGSTVVRIRATFEIYGGFPQSSLAAAYFAFSIQERSPSLSEYPTPNLAMNKVDWMYWEYVPLAHPLFTYAGNETAGADASWTVDVKSSRRITAPDQTLVGMCQILNWSSTPAAKVALTSSVLLKLA